MDQLRDEELIGLVRNGNDLAFAALVNRYAKDLYKLIYKKTGSGETSKDLVQEIFISLWRNIDRVEVNDSLFPYLYAFTGLYISSRPGNSGTAFFIYMEGSNVLINEDNISVRISDHEMGRS